MKSYSLRSRLLVGAAIWVFLALSIAGVLIVQSFATTLAIDRRQDLEANLSRLVASLDPDATISLSRSTLSDPRYDRPLSGFYWQIHDLSTGETVRSRSLWDFEFPEPAAGNGEPRLNEIEGPDGQVVIVLARTVEVASASGTKRYAVATGEERRSRDEHLQRFGMDLGIALALVAAAIIGAAVLQIHLGLSPLRQLREEINSIRSGRSTRLVGSHPLEVMPLVDAVNDLLAGHDQTVDYTRARAADLAHGLKTPLAVLSATAESLRAAGDRVNADTVGMLTEELNARVDYQLRAARLKLRTRTQGAAADLDKAVLRSVSVLRRTPGGGQLNWQVDLEQNLQVDLDEHDLIEMAGALLENAAKWAATRVDVRSQKSGALAILDIEDDGKGVSDDQIALLGTRGRRLDESRAGTGLGLAIVFDIIKLNRGKIELLRSRLGGLHVHLELPLSDGKTEN